MSSDRHRRPPISSRHAFALAFDLAVRRDALHSLVVPLLLWAPWVLAPAVVPALAPSLRPGQVVLLQWVCELANFVVLVLVTAMLRFRARSVFNTHPGSRPAPIRECYWSGLRRAPALYLTECLRNVVFVLSGLTLLLPFLYFGFKLSMATEAVVLRDKGPLRAFAHSFHLTEGRFERWLEMIVLTILVYVPIWFAIAALYVLLPDPGANWTTYFWIGLFLSVGLVPIVQYAWTFFYLRLEEIEAPMIEAGPAYAGGEPGVPSGTRTGPGVPAGSAELRREGERGPRLGLVQGRTDGSERADPTA